MNESVSMPVVRERFIETIRGEERLLYDGPIGEASKFEPDALKHDAEEEPAIWFEEEMLLKKYRKSFVLRAHTQPEITLTRQQAQSVFRMLSEIFKREELAQRV